MRRKLLFFIAIGAIFSLNNAKAISYEGACNPNDNEVAFWEKENFEGKCNKFSEPVYNGKIGGDMSKPALLYEWSLNPQNNTFKKNENTWISFAEASSFKLGEDVAGITICPGGRIPLPDLQEKWGCKTYSENTDNLPPNLKKEGALSFRLNLDLVPGALSGTAPRGTTGDLNDWVTSSDKVAGLQIKWPPSPLGTNITDALDASGGIPILIKYLYEWLLSLGGLAVFIVFMKSGFDYLTSAGDSYKMRQAIGNIRSALLGLALLFGSYLILNTINPQLTTLKIPSMPDYSGKFELTEVKMNVGVEFCNGATLGTATGENIPLRLGSNVFSKVVTVTSIIINGNCLLQLYQKSGTQIDLKETPPTESVYSVEIIQTELFHDKIE